MHRWGKPHSSSGGRRDPIQAVFDRTWEATPKTKTKNGVAMQASPGLHRSSSSPGLHHTWGPASGLTKATSRPLGGSLRPGEMASQEKAGGKHETPLKSPPKRTPIFCRGGHGSPQKSPTKSPHMRCSKSPTKSPHMRCSGKFVTPQKSPSKSPQKRTPFRRSYSFSIGSCAGDPVATFDPKLSGSPQGVRRGSLRKSCGFLDLSAAERRSGACANVKIAFAELSARLHMLVHQVCIAMNELVATIRERHLDDASYLLNDSNYRMLAHIVYQVATSSYHFAKWCHQLEPHAYDLPVKPSRIADSSATGLISQLQSGVSRMQQFALNLCPMLQQNLKAARPSPAQRKLASDAVAPSPWDLAKQRGLSTSEFLEIAPHLEHLLFNTQQLAHARVSQLFAESLEDSCQDTCASPTKRMRPSTAPDGGRRRSRGASAVFEARTSVSTDLPDSPGPEMSVSTEWTGDPEISEPSVSVELEPSMECTVTVSMDCKEATLELPSLLTPEKDAVDSVDELGCVQNAFGLTTPEKATVSADEFGQNVSAEPVGSNGSPDSESGYSALEELAGTNSKP